MPDWLAEPDSSLLLILAAVAVVAIAVWMRTRRQPWLWIAIVCGLLLGLLFLFDKLYQSDREQIGSKLQSTALAVKASDMDRVFANISETFNYASLGKAEFRRSADSVRQRWKIDELVIWDYELLRMDPARKQAEVRFRFKVKSTGSDIGNSFYLCKAEFVRDGDGQWRLRTFKIYPPTGMDQPLAIPGVG